MTWAAGFVVCVVVVVLIGAVAEWVSINRTIDRLGWCLDDQSLNRVASGMRDDETQPAEVSARSCIVLEFKDRRAISRPARTSPQPKIGRTRGILGSADGAAREKLLN